jgi:glycosyltransferase involved in cell wall biosynthesis
VAHCRESGGGLWFTSYPEFAEALELLLGDDGTAETLGRAGRGYVERAYSWERVRERYLEAVGAWAA